MSELSGPPTNQRHSGLRTINPTVSGPPGGGPVNAFHSKVTRTPMYTFRRCTAGWFAVACLVIFCGPLDADTLRIVSWNTANDVSSTGGDTHPPAVGGPAQSVLQAIGALNVTANAPARPLDILALQESAIFTGSGVNPTAQAYANILNAIYPSASYVATIGGTTDGSATGNGPNTLVYNSKTVTLLSQMGVGTASSSGAPRQPVRYQFQPVGSSSIFYLYNDHFKSATDSTSMSRRGTEATTLTNDVNTLPSGSRVVFVGDYNPTGQTADPGYHGVVTGSATNHAIDPLNPNNVAQTWDNTIRYETESPATSAAFTGQSTGGMQFRDDLIMNSPGMLSGNGISFVPGSFVQFGNTATFDANGNQINAATHTNGGAITSSNSTTFAAELSGQYTSAQAATVLGNLTQAADHLPVVADYQLAVPEPSSFALVGAAGAGVVAARRRRRKQLLGTPSPDSESDFRK
jgi:hypothetical protein